MLTEELPGFWEAQERPCSERIEHGLQSIRKKLLRAFLPAYEILLLCSGDRYIHHRRKVMPITAG